jgi:hypothetical protein
MFLNQGTSQPEASQEEEKVNGDIIDMEFVEELDDVQLATIVGGWTFRAAGGIGLPEGYKIKSWTDGRGNWGLGNFKRYKW